jgi:uncharacterized membrane protein YfcA
MPDLLAQALALPGLGWIVLVTFLAGLTYGFAGFGAALVFMPVAARLLPIDTAIAAFAVSSLASFVTLVPRAWGQAERRPVVLMIGTAALSASLGLWLLRSLDVTLMRWAVLAVTAVTLLALIAGWRTTTAPTLAARGAIGAASGLVGGATGLMGPVMVLFQLASPDGVGRARANAIVFLTVTSLLLLPLMALQGMLSAAAVALGALLLVPYGLGARLGQAVFDPAREAQYRGVAFALIAAAIVTGLPVWD